MHSSEQDFQKHDLMNFVDVAKQDSTEHIFLGPEVESSMGIEEREGPHNVEPSRLMAEHPIPCEEDSEAPVDPADFRPAIRFNVNPM